MEEYVITLELTAESDFQVVCYAAWIEANVASHLKSAKVVAMVKDKKGELETIYVPRRPEKQS